MLGSSVGCVQIDPHARSPADVGGERDDEANVEVLSHLPEGEASTGG
jgi:hypothetical protein